MCDAAEIFFKRISSFTERLPFFCADSDMIFRIKAHIFGQDAEFDFTGEHTLLREEGETLLPSPFQESLTYLVQIMIYSSGFTALRNWRSIFINEMTLYGLGEVFTAIVLAALLTNSHENRIIRERWAIPLLKEEHTRFRPC